MREKARERVAKKQVNIELNHEQFEVLDRLARRFGITSSAVLKIGLIQLERGSVLIAEPQAS